MKSTEKKKIAPFYCVAIDKSKMIIRASLNSFDIDLTGGFSTEFGDAWAEMGDVPEAKTKEHSGQQK